MARKFEHLGKMYPGKIDANRRILAIDVTFPKIICLCGSTRFMQEFNDVNCALTLAGYIVLTVGSFIHSDDQLKITEEQKVNLDVLHKFKIDLADGVLVLNVNHYVGSLTRSEIEHATKTKKPVGYLWAPPNQPQLKLEQIVSELLNHKEA
jgi:hypothetical protein